MAIAKFNLLIAEVRAALERLIDVLADLGLAHRHGYKVERPRRRELDTGSRLAEDMGLAYCPLMQVGRLRGIYRRRLSIASGRFAMMASFSVQLVPRPFARARIEQLRERHSRSRQR
ncbi:DUF3363 domain-containing protein [Bradyrhizobium sp. sGM-13]|uniref:DUF3363 domain-containing protein n=1 Tax=Bradyrhizobium sp. sGM-13 TaxID=2831781 RepID=UPI001BCC44B0|nr:DUF3363 domain-containing protein [Bradyrhizobium sp. sGM-13]